MNAAWTWSVGGPGCHYSVVRCWLAAEAVDFPIEIAERLDIKFTELVFKMSEQDEGMQLIYEAWVEGRRYGCYDSATAMVKTLTNDLLWKFVPSRDDHVAE